MFVLLLFLSGTLGFTADLTAKFFVYKMDSLDEAKLIFEENGSGDLNKFYHQLNLDPLVDPRDTQIQFKSFPVSNHRFGFVCRETARSSGTNTRCAFVIRDGVNDYDCSTRVRGEPTAQAAAVMSSMWGQELESVFAEDSKGRINIQIKSSDGLSLSMTGSPYEMLGIEFKSPRARDRK